ncbi:nose resistant to fluoxetine protein 6 isoform X2 [Aethina tumida]|nr:nose resistant to fluoxetine protein 6 isoform X2 [Aethina tumida]
MDDFDSCQTSVNEFCEVKFKLTTLKNDSQVWKAILDTKNNKAMFDHDNLNRLMCLEKNINKSLSEVTDKWDTEYSYLDLRFNVDNVICKNYVGLFKIDLYDYIFLTSLAIYIAFLAYATYAHHKSGESVNKHIKAFSVWCNWKLALKDNQNTDFQKLKIFQYVRTISMVSVVLCHSQMSVGTAYIENTEYLENAYKHPLLSLVPAFDSYVVQIFFVISAWLLLIQVYEIKEKHGEFTLKSAYTIFINRVLRLWPSLILMILLHKSKISFKMYTGPFMELLVQDHNNCNNNWWQPLLFVNNLFLESKEMCNVATWYLSVDTQLYLASLIILYIMIKYNLGLKTLIALFSFISLIYAGVIYYNHVDMVVQIGPEISKLEKLISTRSIDILYFSTIANTNTFILGLCFGLIYYKKTRKEQYLYNNKTMSVIFYLSGSLSFIVLFITSTYNHRGVLGALVGSLLKPIFCLGICIFLLGVAEGRGGIVKKICEAKIFSVVANFTYCTYIFHFAVVFQKHITQRNLLNLNMFTLMYIFLTDVFQSFWVGFVMYFLIEKPMQNLQKTYGPKTSKIAYKTSCTLEICVKK